MDDPEADRRLLGLAGDGAVDERFLELFGLEAVDEGDDLSATTSCPYDWPAT
jgi:hypothetical protein